MAVKQARGVLLRRRELPVAAEWAVQSPPPVGEEEVETAPLSVPLRDPGTGAAYLGRGEERREERSRPLLRRLVADSGRPIPRQRVTRAGATKRPGPASPPFKTVSRPGAFCLIKVFPDSWLLTSIC